MFGLFGIAYKLLKCFNNAQRVVKSNNEIRAFLDRCRHISSIIDIIAQNVKIVDGRIMPVIIDGFVKVPSKKNKMKVGKGKVYKDGEIKSFEHYLRLIAVKAMREQNIALFSVPVTMNLIITNGDRRRRDLQNAFGAICDAMNGIVYKDDYLIHQIIASKRYKKGEWSFRIIISEM